MVTHEVDRMGTCHIYLIGFAISTAIHVVVDGATADVDDGAALGGTFATAAKHVAFHLAAADADGGTVFIARGAA